MTKLQDDLTNNIKNAMGDRYESQKANFVNLSTYPYLPNEDKRLERKRNLLADENSKHYYLFDGVIKKPFILKFEENYFKKSDILFCGEPEYKVRITKVYKYNWYRKLLNFFGIPFKLFNCVKVEEIKDDKSNNRS